MKTRLLKFITLCVVIALLFPCYAQAVTPNESRTKLSVYTDPCPDEVLNYAKSAYQRLLMSAILDGTVSATGTCSLGTPFTIANSESESPVYYFPIINREKTIATFRVYLDLECTLDSGVSTYTGILSPFLAEELNALSERELSAPVLIYADNGNIRVKVGNSCETIIPSNDASVPNSTLTVDSVAQLHTVNPSMAIDTREFVQPRASSQAALTLSIIETQGNDSWCGAYSTAIILRYLLGSSTTPTARTLMEYVHGEDVENSDAFSVPNTLAAGVRYGFSPTEVIRPLSATEVFAQIDACKPIYVNARRYDSSVSMYKYHAIVVRGYNRVYDTFSIWNPWHSYYETMDLNTKQYVASSTITYTWYATVYDW